MKKSILFLDANKRATLSIIRAIGKKKEYRIYCAGERRLALCRPSIMTDKYFIYENPEKSHSLFIKSLKELVEEVNPDYIFPCSDATLFSIYNSDLYEVIKSKLIAPEKDAYMKSLDKQYMNELAKSCNVKIIEEASTSNLSFPIVIKPRFSRNLLNDEIVYGFRKFVYDEESFIKNLNVIRSYDKSPLLQKKIEGRGFGIFAAAKEGEIFASFAHERVREVPLTGGVSTLRASKQVNPFLLEASKKIIKKLNWTGIVMVEFKGVTEENAYFIEVNGRPWGSMDLAVSSGVNFPEMMNDLFIHNNNFNELKKKYNKPYNVNYYSRWIVGELNYVRYIVSSHLPIKTRLKKLANVLKKPPHVSYDTFKWNDPLPFLFELSTIIVDKLTHLMKRKKMKWSKLK
ncbi:hypothetical protein CIB95_10440 [Lottiidibacillus patelloidae]|uniref:ATP-grasp domain-containing protein n=1 Tax=Lottiidibacillus patelloidae TaxID=2670334 RepID=A0A263BSE7_9BACI|nr:ATP-grasp domain-containing protein [Lottiidibacillus patelloidae]OZM56634.1 hypothetical protein CIB95_10440 [Lottiidibacillus patelloidae]